MGRFALLSTMLIFLLGLTTTVQADDGPCDFKKKIAPPKQGLSKDPLEAINNQIGWAGRKAYVLNMGAIPAAMDQLPTGEWVSNPYKQRNVEVVVCDEDRQVKEKETFQLKQNSSFADLWEADFSATTEIKPKQNTVTASLSH